MACARLEFDESSIREIFRNHMVVMRRLIATVRVRLQGAQAFNRSRAENRYPRQSHD